MKKLFFAVAMLAVTFSASAQLTFGVKAGASLSAFNGLDGNMVVAGATLSEQSTSFKFGANAGIFAEYRLSDMFGVQSEILYSIQGVNYKGNILVLNYTGNYSASYINVPVLAKLHFSNLAVYAGPQFGFLVGLKQTSINGDDKTITTIAAEEYNAIDLSIAIGASYMITSNIGVDARYNLGLTNVFAEKKDNNGNVTREAYGKNGSIQVGVFYAF